MPQSLLDCTDEILEEILVQTCAADPFRPPHEVYALQLTANALYARIAPSACPRLYAHIFDLKFDATSPNLRLADAWGLRAVDVTTELCSRLRALRIFQRGAPDDPRLPGALITAWSMMLEDDGRNSEHLRRAGLPALLVHILRLRVGSRSSPRGSWPTEDLSLSLAVALFWALNSADTVAEEAADLRQEMLDILSPFAFAAFRYPCSNLQEDQFTPLDVADEASPNISWCPGSSSCPFPRPQPVEVTYLGNEAVLRPPPAALYAMLALIACVDQRPMEVPEFLPRTRADALALFGPNQRMPTQEDIIYFNMHGCTRPRNHSRARRRQTSDRASACHDEDWARWFASKRAPSIPRRLGTTAYRLGSLSGSWYGSCLIPDRIAYASMLEGAEMPSAFPPFARMPVCPTFEEHYCTGRALARPASDDGLKNAWLPPSFFWSQRAGGIEVSDGEQYKAVYKTFDGVSLPEDPITDVIITGHTVERHAQAWGRYRWIGRVRLSDGFVALLRESMDSQLLSRAIFKGYLVSSQHFVGRWQEPARGPSTWEAIWSVARVHQS